MDCFLMGQSGAAFDVRPIFPTNEIAYEPGGGLGGDAISCDGRELVA